MENAYDAVPYESYAFAQTHPSRLAAIAVLMGMQPTPIETCRVLEIGCASGGNILPMACEFPGARFVGLDYSAVQIKEAETAKDELKLANIEFICADICEVNADDLGQFDYIIAHGIYSWIPDQAQKAMLALYRDCLKPQGVGYVSYNTLPGWHMRGIVRDLMKFQAELFESPQEKVSQARALLDFAVQHLPTENNPYGLLLKNELEKMANEPDFYLLHDHLETHNEPLYFRDFMARAAENDLKYLGEVEFHTMLGRGIAEAARAKLAEAGDIVRQEQYQDFMVNRHFRQTLLVHQSVPLNRQVSGERLTSLYLSGRFECESTPKLDDAESVEFKIGSSSFTVGNPLSKAALMVLTEAFPETLSFDELFERVWQRLPTTVSDSANKEAARVRMADDLVLLYTAPNSLHLGFAPFKLGKTVADFPKASDYARWQVQKSNHITTLKMERLQVAEPGLSLLPFLDGQHDRAALRQALFEKLQNGTLTLQLDGVNLQPAIDDPILGNILTSSLESLAQAGLLCGGGEI